MTKQCKDSSFFILTEEALKNAVLEVLKENRKVLRVGGSQPSPSLSQIPQQNMQQTQMGGMPMDNSVGQVDNSMGGMPIDNGMDGEPNAEQNQFDTNFDAGVEADEETDPKRYIQQLTGKLSQTLNSYNNENGPDTGLSKYVASMIIAASCKNLDEKAKKELIEKINTASSDDMENSTDNGSEDVPDDMGQEEQPMMESIITKKQLQELAFGTTKKRKETTQKNENGKKNIFGGKSF